MQTDPRTNLRATDWLALVLDSGWSLTQDDLRSGDPLRFPGYEVPDHESVVAASGTAGGYALEAVAFDFSTFGGSLGVVAGERIARAFERAIERRAGVLVLLSTGGARMQEGMVALTQMAKTVVARQALAKAGLPFIAYLRHPTTGGAYASFGGLADLVWAQPGATVGFAGPRVAEEMSGRPLPEGSHTAEFALERGLIDEIVAPDDLKDRTVAVLDVLLGDDATASATTAPTTPSANADADTGARPLDAWEQVSLARRSDRPTARAFAERIATGLVEIRGDRAGTSRIGAMMAIGRIGGRRAGIIAHERKPLPPAAFRATQRLVRLSGRFSLPLVTFVDTPGADPTSASEAGGIVRAITGTFRDLLEHPRPVVCVVTGEGGSGGALAFACGDRLLILEHAIFSVIGPEGAAAILRRTDVDGVARDLRPSAHDLIALGIADAVLPEAGGGAHERFDETAAIVRAAVAHALDELPPDPRPQRAARWREAGNRFLA
jgi:acetyl-CoA carboxylase carboxyl transferase subunit beta